MEKFGIGKTIEDIITQVEGLYPRNDILFSMGALSEESAINRREYIKRLLCFPMLDVLTTIDYLQEAILSNKNALFLPEFEREYGIPDNLFQDRTTNEKRIANIFLKQLQNDVYGVNTSTGGESIGILDYLSQIGIVIEVLSRQDNRTGIFPKYFPYLFGGYGYRAKFILYIRILQNNPSYSVDFIKLLVQTLVNAQELVVIIS